MAKNKTKQEMEVRQNHSFVSPAKIDSPMPTTAKLMRASSSTVNIGVEGLTAYKAEPHSGLPKQRASAFDI